MTSLRTTGTVLRLAASWLALAAAFGLLLVLVVVPRLGGATAYTILTGSMKPELPPGTLVVVKPTTFDDIDVGEVVTYQLHTGERTTVTHRVIGRTVDPEGRPALITKGDANNAPDPDVVIAAQLKGTRWFSLPYVGRANLLAVGQRPLAQQAVAAGLLLYAAVMFTGAARQRRTGAANAPRHKVPA